MQLTYRSYKIVVSAKPDVLQFQGTDPGLLLVVWRHLSSDMSLTVSELTALLLLQKLIRSGYGRYRWRCLTDAITSFNSLNFMHVRERPYPTGAMKFAQVFSERNLAKALTMPCAAALA
jgi:hypothetical protein